MTVATCDNIPRHIDITDADGLPMPVDPRRQMAQRLPGLVQPFLTWLTAKPGPD